jgi:pyruvate formate lyase activating enzyme
LTGRIFEIQRYCIHDGPGIRTTVFLKGCPLNCLWCHNPEGIAPQAALSFIPARCIGCGYCFRACERGAHAMTDAAHTLDRARCGLCGRCARECHAGALELVGRDISVEDALAEVLKDRPFYETSGGGMTLSGGEPLMQIEFTAALLGAARGAGLNTCVETCGFADYGRFERILGSTDLFLYDLKETDAARHEEFTGAPLAPILRNLRSLHDAGAAILLRLPIVPGCNDRDEHLRAVAALARELPRLRGVEIMPYHRLGESKLERMGLAGRARAQAAPPSAKEVGRWLALLKAEGVRAVGPA